MTKINDMKVEKREPNSSLKLKKKSNGNQSIKENVPSTPTVSTVSYEDEAVTKVSNIKMTPKVLMVSKSNVICTCMSNVQDIEIVLMFYKGK